MSIENLIGREVRFECQPYDTGRGIIRKLTPGTHGWENYFVVEVEVIEGQTRNRLFSAVSYTPMTAGRMMKMYHFSQRDLEGAVSQKCPLVHVYPV